MQRTRVEVTSLRCASFWLAALTWGFCEICACHEWPLLLHFRRVAALSCLQVLQDEGSQALVSSSAKRPTGRVVGVIRRNWRTRGYAGKHLDKPYCTCQHASHTAC
jgi:hypothetical protein